MVAENVGRGESGGIDILQLAAAAKESLHSVSQEMPPQNITVDTETKHKKRNQKKTLLKRKDGTPTNKYEHAKVQIKPRVDSQNNAITKPFHEVLPASEPTDGQSDVILKRNDVKANISNNKETHVQKKQANNPPNKNQQYYHHNNSIYSLQQELVEVKTRLEQEKTVRKSIEVHYQKIQNEVNSARQTLEHETQFRKNCQRDNQHLKEELANVRVLHEKAQYAEANFNKLISTEKLRSKELEKQLHHEQQAKEAVLRELEHLKALYASDRIKEQSLRDELAAAQQINNSLQQKMTFDSASAASMKMELHSMKSRMGKVEEIENALKHEILKVDRLQNELAKVDAIREELGEAKEQLTRIDSLKMELLLERSKVQELEIKIDDQTWLRKRGDPNDITTRGKRSESTSSFKHDDMSDLDDIHVERLRKELHDVREALKAERTKNAALTSKKTKAEASSLKDWIDLALPSTAEVKLPPATQISLSSQADVKKEEAPTHSELHYFDGTKNEFCGHEDTSPLEDELIFIMSAYSSDEVIVSDCRDKVTYLINLPTQNSDEIQVRVSVHIPNGYPLKGMLDIDIRIADDSNCSSDLRKCLLDALPKLTQMCLWEAEGNYGREALFSVLNMADRWSKTEWPGILSKQFPSFQILKRPKQKTGHLYSALIYTHHLIEQEKEKIQLVKKITSKLSQYGYIKMGKPGFILLTSINEADCDTVLNELKSQASQKILKSTVFRLAGKVLTDTPNNVATTRMTVLDNNKDGMDELTRCCANLGLTDVLQEII